ncbi:MAG: MBL fold metallo-hydrolase [Ignavibacteria bacterium RIFOXYB2_FULL_35_12]|nr:MAG: MBL fold metallo-hydrolase [Ignavibacteria bacterium GWA2_36_19]OGU52088.1 MAG: MBL fold metallo-hydrolase [Ignavibacteria bacterium GWC2_35_8]OGU62967.1 MAG: MBL fold metallo-hydrolase [Ignavibacteria bacterium GWF2_35_20]OGU79459.1 MAG: MBL fold metallo-hydrolase [Ignavibacteria bacterium RIFOXYA2_FULL_35_9]OGU86582.1 MAG: MBL fold metallo-hydrolase [Ignavibacteria bacterium RIFOXYC12_FULL_35_11]OGU89044.1 MAG: MBL fold metallo-hydrolase [Ignavibacteria bacterium RIFOXYA12_FULL_35_25
MKIGKYQIHITNSGYFYLDGGAMFGIIPKPLWEKTNPADEVNRIKLATRNLLLVSDDKKILIDTGMGNKWSKKSADIYRIEQDEFSLRTTMVKFSIKPENITDVLLTHLHFDHTGGSTEIIDGKPTPAFKNAKYHVSEKNFNWAMNPSKRDKGSYIKDNFLPLFENGVLFLIKDKIFDDGIELIEVNGHTFGMQLIKISDSSNTILFCADLFPTSSHIPLPYVMGYDLQPLITVEEKKQILLKAVEENWILCFEHDPFYAFATVEKTETGYRAKEKLNEL